MLMLVNNIVAQPLQYIWIVASQCFHFVFTNWNSALDKTRPIVSSDGQQPQAWLHMHNP